MDLSGQLRFLYLYEGVSAFSITDAVWVLLLLSRGFDLWQVGIAESVFHAVSLVCEVPSGFAADLFGRRRALVLSGCTNALSCLVLALSTDLPGVCAGMGLSALSYNLASGTREAITYDSLALCGSADRYLAVSVRQEWIFELARAAGSACGAAALAMGWRGAYLLSAALGLLAALAAARLQEVCPARSTAHSSFAQQLRRHLTADAAFLKNNPRADCQMLACGLAAAGAYLAKMFLQQRIVDTAVDTLLVGVLLLPLSLASALGAQAARHRRGSFFALALACGTGVGAALCLCALPGACFALTGGAAAAFCSSLFDLRAQELVQQSMPAENRAALGSVFSLLYSLCMVALSPAVGALCACLGAGVGLAALGCLLAALFWALGGTYRLAAARRKN